MLIVFRSDADKRGPQRIGQRQVGNRHTCAGRTKDDDPSVPAGDHAGNGGADRHHSAHHCQLEAGTPVILPQRQEGARLGAAGVDHEHVKPAEGLIQQCKD
jgi:hypothetical protein